MYWINTLNYAIFISSYSIFLGLHRYPTLHWFSLYRSLAFSRNPLHSADENSTKRFTTSLFKVITWNPSLTFNDSFWIQATGVSTEPIRDAFLLGKTSTFCRIHQFCREFLCLHAFQCSVFLKNKERCNVIQWTYSDIET